MPELRLDDLAVADDEPQRALALDAGEALDLEALGPRPSPGRCRRSSVGLRVRAAGRTGGRRRRRAARRGRR